MTTRILVVTNNKENPRISSSCSARIHLLRWLTCATLLLPLGVLQAFTVPCTVPPRIYSGPSAATSDRLVLPPSHWALSSDPRRILGRSTTLLLSSSSSSSSSASLVSSNEDLKPGIAAIQSSNEQLLTLLEEVRHQPYFRLYSVDILASCEYMPQELFECYTESCEIYPADEGEVSQSVVLTCVS